MKPNLIAQNINNLSINKYKHLLILLTLIVPWTVIVSAGDCKLKNNTR